jgi:hypothetical protein
MLTQIQTSQKPLGILNGIDLPEGTLAMLEKLETAQFSYVREKLSKSGEIAPERMDAVEIEFKKFMAISYLEDRPIGMSSKEVDAFWHQFILFTRSYFDFCMTTFGQFIHHQPNTSATPLEPAGSDNFRNAYTTYFGEIPEMWLKNEQPCTDCCSNDCSSIGDSCSGDHGQDE